jgi:hypothetical protein
MSRQLIATNCPIQQNIYSSCVPDHRFIAICYLPVKAAVLFCFENTGFSFSKCTSTAA